MCVYLNLTWEYCCCFTVDLASWHRDMVEDSAPDTGDATGSEVKVEHEEDFSYKAHQKYRDGVLTIGCCGMFVGESWGG